MSSDKDNSESNDKQRTGLLQQIPKWVQVVALIIPAVLYTASKLSKQGMELYYGHLAIYGRYKSRQQWEVLSFLGEYKNRSGCLL
jgi:hypothetical protein